MTKVERWNVSIKLLKNRHLHLLNEKSSLLLSMALSSKYCNPEPDHTVSIYLEAGITEVK